MILDNEQLTRRSFLEISAAVAGRLAARANGISLGMAFPDSYETNIGFKPPAPSFREHELQQRFDVAFLSPSPEDIQILARQSGCGSSAKRERLMQWSDKALDVVEATMERLPGGLYAPALNDDAEPHYLELALVDFPIIDRLNRREQPKSKGRHARLEQGRHVVVLPRSKMHLTGVSLEEARKLILHEIAHYKTSIRRKHYIDSVCEPVGVGNLDDLRLVFDSELSTTFEPDGDECSETPGEPREKLKHKSHVGYGATDYGEFFSIAAEYYADGEDDFKKIYRPFFRKKTGLFYDLIREHIFDGQELRFSD